MRYVGLDAIRGLSAILVCAGHLRSAVFIDFSQITNPNLFDKFFYFTTGLGHQAVMIFFVLSGFFVGGTALRSGQHFNVTVYAVSRLTRLWTVLLPALLLTLLADHVTATLNSEILDGSRYADWSSGPQQPSYTTSITAFFANVLFLQTITSPVFGSNGPLWSLANEFWYYAIFPLFCIALGVIGQYSKTSRIFAGLIGVVICIILPFEVLVSFQVWLMGVAAYLISQKFPPKSRFGALFITTLTFLTCLIYSKRTDLQDLLLINSDILIGLSFSLVCTVISSWSKKPIHNKNTPPKKAAFIASEISYSLYLTHFPLLVLFSAAFLPYPQLSPSFNSYLNFLSALLLLITSGATFYYCFERKSPTIRYALMHYLKLSNDVRKQKTAP